MATAKERLAIFENILARVGVDGDVLGEYSKALSTLNGMQTFQEMQPPIPNAQNIAPQGQNEPMGGNSSMGMGESTSQLTEGKYDNL